MNASLQLDPDRKRERYKFKLDDVFRMLEAGILPSDPKLELIEGELVQRSRTPRFGTTLTGRPSFMPVTG